MSESKGRLESLVVHLHEIEAVKFGSFKLKSGILSPLYLDLRVIVSYPDVLEEVGSVMWSSLKDIEFDFLCGVPYTALPIATVMSLRHGKPMLMRRKEVKDYGTRKAIEGVFEKGQSVLIVEDLVTSGGSVLETVEPLKIEGLNVHHAVVLVDREQGGEKNLAEAGITLHSVLKLSFLLKVLVEHNKISKEMEASVLEFISGNQTSIVQTKSPRLSYAKRALLSKCLLAKRCFEIMEKKQTNLAVAADVTETAELLALADKVGPHICVLKTHVDILDEWNGSLATLLTELAERHEFLIFEDRKFADIGNTVVQQYSGGIYKIAEWAHITNAHLVPGPGIIDGLASIGMEKSRGLLLLAEMSSQGTLAKGSYTQTVVEAALKRPEFVMGFISIHPSSWTAHQNDDAFRGMVQMTPGVALTEKGDHLGQQYNTPESVIGERGSDVMIVGRGIIKAEDPQAAALTYKNVGWKAYQESL